MRVVAFVAAAALLAAPGLGAEVLRVNQADQAQLEAIGLSPSQAAQVVRYRTENGAFLQAEELLAVPQIAKPVFETIRPLLTVEDVAVPPPPPIAVDTAKTAVVIEQPRAEWQNLYGAIVYSASATVRNTGTTPLRAVRVRLEVLDASGQPVAAREGHTLTAEALDADPKAAVTPIAAGGSDPLRLSLDKSEITRPFRSIKLTVIDAPRP